LRPLNCPSGVTCTLHLPPSSCTCMCVCVCESLSLSLSLSLSVCVCVCVCVLCVRERACAQAKKHTHVQHDSAPMLHTHVQHHRVRMRRPSINLHPHPPARAHTLKHTQTHILSLPILSLAHSLSLSRHAGAQGHEGLGTLTYFECRESWLLSVLLSSPPAWACVSLCNLEVYMHVRVSLFVNLTTFASFT
jgi:hypothetical protein